MASAKRKDVTDDVTTFKKSNKRLKTDVDTTKRSKLSTDVRKESSKQSSKTATPATGSTLAKEQPAFPRGGAGLLTPLERKQVSAKASRDAAAEHKRSSDLFGATTAPQSDSEYGQSEDEQTSSKDQLVPKKSKKKSKTKGAATSKEETIPIESLSYKRLAVGSLILGCITSVNSRDLTISLPNNLTGFVSLTDISSQFSKKIEAEVKKAAEDGESESEEDAEDEDITLGTHFRRGQFVRVAVTMLGDDASDKPRARRRIGLSLDPQHTNVGLTKSSLCVGCMVQAAVVSVEDHGVVVDLGLKGKGAVRGFIPAKGLDPSAPLAEVKEGSVFLCTITSLTSDGKIVKLSSDFTKGVLLKSPPTVDSLLPGAFVEMLVTEADADGIAGKIMGMVDATADVVHSGSFKDREAFSDKYKPGQKLKGRLICTFPHSEQKRLGFSVLDQMTSLSVRTDIESGGVDALKLSSVVPSARVVRVVQGLGIYLVLPTGDFGFAHISRLSDKKVDAVNETIGPFKIGSDHQTRILDYNPIDNLFILSLQKKVIQQPFLRLEDVKVGEKVKGSIEKLVIGPNGVQGLVVSLADGVTGLVPSIHISDIALLHPERKFREGNSILARVLSLNLTKRQIRLTAKKSLVNSDQTVWSNFDDISVGDSTVGTLVKVYQQGALVQFYGPVKGFLPVSEMSEAYIKDATEHFKVGQVLTVNAISVSPEREKLTLSCREQNASVETALANVIPGTFVVGTVFEKSQGDLLLRLDTLDTIARLPLDHVCDGSERKRRAALEKIRVGQQLEDLLVVDVQRKNRLVNLSNKQTLIKAAQSGQFLKSFEDLREDIILTGFASNITEDGVFIRFANNITGLIPRKQLAPDTEDQPQFGLQLLQAVTARVMSIDYRGATPRFWLTMREKIIDTPEAAQRQTEKPIVIPDIVHAVDDSITSFSEFITGKVTKARITSIKDTQMNVELAQDIQGRIDVSELFDSWEEIKDRKHPLKSFNPKQVLNVRILGAHDTRNHRFLPLTHRSGKNTVFELSAKSSALTTTAVEPLSLTQVEQGSSWLAFVNHIGEDHLMVNISPCIRGRIKAIDVSDDLTLAGDLDQNFPVGSALRVKVLSVDVEKNHLDLTGKLTDTSKLLSLNDLSPGTILPGRVTKITDRAILVQLSPDIVGAVDLIDVSDDFATSNTAAFQKNDIIRVFVAKVDIPNKKIVLSTRPSKVLSSSLKVEDVEITSAKQLKVNDVVRGFVSNVSDKGLFITLGHGVTAFVRVTNLSDSFLKNWKDNYQRDQLVKGKVIAVDHDSGHVQLSLKQSVLDANYKPPRTMSSMQVGDIVTGKVAKVETFGVFIVVDNSENVRGLCHRSEIAEQRIADVTKLFNEGDAVKAVIRKIDLPNRRINFSMKASYFVNEDEDDGSDAEIVDAELKSDDDDNMGDAAVSLDESQNEDVDDDDDDDEEDASGAYPESDDGGAELSQASALKSTGLSVGGFDWYGMPEPSAPSKPAAKSTSTKPKAKKRKVEIQIDQTGDLDANGPQSTDDFERLLLGEPDSSILWLQYMAFHLELGDTDQARAVGERALKTISLGQDTEKLNIWIAQLNLENAYGDDESIDAVFRRACGYNDPQEIHNRLTSIYIQSGKHQKADDLFQESLKKFTQDPKVYINYATFLFDTAHEPDKGRAVLSRALQILPAFTHFDLTSKFAQLEFKSSAGLAERGRTIFEGLINSFPKRVDLFNVMLDMEMRPGGDGEGDNKEQIRALFERIVARKLKPKQAKHFFKRWLEFEEEGGDERKIDEVKGKAATWVKQAASS